MAKVIDLISLTVLIFFLTFLWSAYLFHGYIGALIFSSAMTLIFVITVRYVKTKLSKPYSYDRLALEFSLRGNEYVISLFKRILKGCEGGSNYIVMKNAVLISAFKFSNLTLADMPPIINLTKQNFKKTAYVITRGIERKAYSVLRLENVSVVIVKTKTVFRFLKKHGELPSLAPVKEKISLGGVFEAIFNRANFRSYAFSGTVLTLVSFLTPMRIYYMVFGSILILLALLTLTPLGKGSIFSKKVESELENEIDNAQISIDEL